MKTIILAIITGMCLLAVPLPAHYDPMIELSAPTPPPTLDPGPEAALVRVKIIDSGTGRGTSATVSVNGGMEEPEHDPLARFSLRKSGNRLKGPIRFRLLDWYFYSDSMLEVRVPPGNVTVELRKGYEYLPCRLALEAAPRDTLTVSASMEPWVDMAQAGWYSGDTHIHMERTGANDDTLLSVTSARGIRYAFLLSMNTDGYDRGGRYESWLQAKGLGDRGEYSREGYYLSSGQEYRVGALGHVTVILPDKYAPGVGPTSDVNRGPSLAVIADQAHDLRGLIGLAHGGYHNQEADGLLLAAKMDFLELLQFGGYRSLGLDGWYDFLNLGYRLPIVGACDFPYTRELGSEITYARCEGAPTPRQWAQAVAAGRSFATSGPMLFLEVDGNQPGDILRLRPDEERTIEVAIRARSLLYPVRFVELIVNGLVVAREMLPERSPELNLKYSLKIRESSWIAARAYAEAGTEAHTNPVYVYRGGSLPFNRDSARNILARLEGSIETIPNPEVVKRLESLVDSLSDLLAKGGAGGSLPRPPVPGDR